MLPNLKINTTFNKICNFKCIKQKRRLLQSRNIYNTSFSKGSIYSDTGPICPRHRVANSHKTRPHAYISMRRKASREKLMAPSSTSGAIYRRVPTCEKNINEKIYSLKVLHGKSAGIRVAEGSYKKAV